MGKRNFGRAKWFIIGVLATLMLSGTALLASPAMREIVFGVNVSLDGQNIQFEEDMRPFIMDGRTFLPVRAIADIAGLDVDFDADTNTVVLTTAEYQLVGTQWAWDGYAAWQYFFHADGTGVRGVASSTISFDWWAYGNHLLIETGYMLESWTFAIDGDIMTLASRQVAGLEYSYIRVGSDTAATGTTGVLGQRQSNLPTLGTWSGNVFTSEYLGFRLTMTGGWVAHTDAEISDAMLEVVDILDGHGFVMDGDGPVSHVSATNNNTGVTVQIYLEELFLDVTAQESVEITAQSMELIGGSGNVVAGTTRIGNYNWHMVDTELDFAGLTIYGRVFVSIEDGIRRTIMISYLEDSPSPEDTLRMFREL